MSWTPDQMPDQTGRVAVIAGPHDPKGHATARELARHGAHVVLLGGSIAALVDARTVLLSDVPEASICITAVTEPAPQAARAAAARVLAIHPRVDLLVLNTSPLLCGDEPSRDVVPALDIPALGHFALTAALMPGLLASSWARIVSVTPLSDLRHTDHAPDDDHPVDIHVARQHDVISLLDFPLELHRRLQRVGSHVHSLAADPGRGGDLTAVLDTVGGALSRRFDQRRTTQRAHSQLQAATDPAACGGQLYVPMFNTCGPPMSLPLHGSFPAAAAARQWDATGHHAGVTFALNPQDYATA